MKSLERLARDSLDILPTKSIEWLARDSLDILPTKSIEKLACNHLIRPPPLMPAFFITSLIWTA